MINNAKFQIIGRIGKITKHDKVTHISIASDRQVKDDDGKWTTEAVWNSVTVFSESMRKRLNNEKVGRKGTKLILEGTIQSNSYQKDGKTNYTVDLIAFDFDVLEFVKDGE